VTRRCDVIEYRMWTSTYLIYLHTAKAQRGCCVMFLESCLLVACSHFALSSGANARVESAHQARAAHICQTDGTSLVCLPASGWLATFVD
jgi:hypothetical protein